MTQTLTVTQADQTDVDQDKDLLRAIRGQIAALRAEIDSYCHALSLGDDDFVRHCPEVKRLGTLYHQCIETEQRLAKFTRTESQTSFENLDLGALRDTIGRKLDRLRATGCPGAIPGEPDA